MERVFVLELEHGKFYVGKATNIFTEILRTKHESPWVKKYPTIDIVAIFESRDIDDVVAEYMWEHGVDNVRGGSFSQIKLNDADSITTRKFMCRGSHCGICQSREDIYDTNAGKTCGRCLRLNLRTERCCGYENSWYPYPL